MKEKPKTDALKRRPLGIDKGKVFIGDHFDDPLPEFEDSFDEDFENDPLLQTPHKPQTGD